MATLDEIGQQRQRVSEQLARLDTERARLAGQLSELEIAERVLTKFGRRGLENKAPKGKLGGSGPRPVESRARGSAGEGYSGGARRSPESC